MIQFDEYFSNGLKPPTSNCLLRIIEEPLPQPNPVFARGRVQRLNSNVVTPAVSMRAEVSFFGWGEDERTKNTSKNQSKHPAMKFMVGYPRWN